MKKIVLLPFLMFTFLFTMNVQAQSTTGGNEENPNIIRTNPGTREYSIMNPNRKLITTPDWSDAAVETTCTISMILTVDQDGRVMSAKTIGSKTTTSDPLIFDYVIEKVKSEALYEAKPGSASERVPYEFLLEAK